jgi:hypothetical protein
VFVDIVVLVMSDSPLSIAGYMHLSGDPLQQYLLQNRVDKFHSSDVQHNISRLNGNAVPFLCSSGHSSWLLTQGFRVRFLELPDFLSSSRSGMGSTQPL